MKRYLAGTAYIVYGNAPESSSIKVQNEQSASNSKCHNHSERENSPCHFWAVFLPDREIPSGIEMERQQSLDQTKEENIEYRVFVLRGTPHPWGTFPQDMPPPHGCIPPRLYYHVSIIESSLASKPSPECQTTKPENNTSSEIINSSGSNNNEWTLPFIHRFGDGDDDAGGLTSAYFLLENLEDADDGGEFLEQKFQHFKTGDPPILYTSTQVLFSEQRTLQILDQHVFSHLSKKCCSNHNTDVCISGTPDLCELQNNVAFYLDETKSLKSDQFPFSILKSDMKLVLPSRTLN